MSEERCPCCGAKAVEVVSEGKASVLYGCMRCAWYWYAPKEEVALDVGSVHES